MEIKKEENKNLEVKGISYVDLLILINNLEVDNLGDEKSVLTALKYNCLIQNDLKLELKKNE